MKTTTDGFHTIEIQLPGTIMSVDDDRSVVNIRIMVGNGPVLHEKFTTMLSQQGIADKEIDQLVDDLAEQILRWHVIRLARVRIV